MNNIQPDHKIKRRNTARQSSGHLDKCKGGKWTEDEHKRFLDALEMFGNIWKNVEAYVGTRSTAQIRSHAQKYFQKLRTQALAELRKNNQLHRNVFLIIREYRNYTHNPSIQKSLAPIPMNLLKSNTTANPEHTCQQNREIENCANPPFLHNQIQKDFSFANAGDCNQISEQIEENKPYEEVDMQYHDPNARRLGMEGENYSFFEEKQYDYCPNEEQNLFFQIRNSYEQ